MIATQLRRLSSRPGAMASAYSVYHGAANASSNGSPLTITAMSRWSSISKPLPGVFPASHRPHKGLALLV